MCPRWVVQGYIVNTVEELVDRTELHAIDNELEREEQLIDESSEESSDESSEESSDESSEESSDESSEESHSQRGM